MVLTSEGRLRPQVKQPIDKEISGRIMSVCPGKIVTGPHRSQLNGDGPCDGIMHPIFGPLRTWHRGWCSDEKVRWRAAAGGSLTALASFLLESGRVQQILHVRASKEDPTRTEALISQSVSEVLAGCQSRYGPAAPLVHVCRLLDEGVTFAVIAKPCDIAAIRALARVDPRVEKQVPYCLSIFCGGLPSRTAALKIAEHHGVREDDIGLCRYRGHGWPGLMTIGKRSDGQEFGTTYNETWKWNASPLGPDAGIAKYDIQWRCKICPDAVGELADVACPDGWLYDPVKKAYVSEEGANPGQNLVLSRTAAGEELVQACAKAGKLVLAPLRISELEEMHWDHYPRKCSWPVRVLASWFFFRPARLQVVNYRPVAAFWACGLWKAWQVLRGTWQRLRSGADLEIPL